MLGNLVQDRMTMAETTRILGLPPSYQGADFVECGAGTPEIQCNSEWCAPFELQDGKIVNVP